MLPAALPGCFISFSFTNQQKFIFKNVFLNKDIHLKWFFVKYKRSQEHERHNDRRI